MDHDTARGSTRTMPTPSYRGRPSAPAPDEGPTYDELYEEAKRRKLSGRSKMSKTELERALGR